MGQKDDTSVALVSKAYDFAQKAHIEQKRHTGEPYFIHPAEVAYYLAEAGLDA